MAETENPVERSPGEIPAAEPVTLARLQQQMESLRTLLNGSLMALLLVSTALTIYFWYQDRMLTKELTNARLIVRDYDEVKKPLVAAFVERLREYAQTHPDFNPILEKYRIQPQPGATNPASTQPKPAR